MTEAIDGMHPDVAEVLGAAEEMQSRIDQIERFEQESLTAKFLGFDEDRTVSVTVNGRGCLTGLYLENGLLRLGAELVSARINEALSNAQQVAEEAAGAQQGARDLGVREFSPALLEKLERTHG